MRKDALAGGVAFALSLAVYAATLAPSLPPGHDSAELTTAAALAGIAHPPGYPLYTMVGHLFTLLPVGDVAFRLNLMAALFGALAAGLAAAAFAVLSGSPLAGASAALAFAFARTPWRLAVGAEVFSMHLAVVAGLLLLAALWRGARDRRRCVAAMALLFGLGLAHHQTVVLLLPGLALWLWRARDGRPVGWTPWAPGLLAVGLLPYAWLPLRASQDPPLNWGDPDSARRFWWVLTRSGYGSLSLSTVSGAEPAAGFHVRAFFESLALRQFPVLGTLLGAGGAMLVPEALLPGGLWLMAGPAWAVIGAQPPGDGFLDMMERFYASADLGFAGLVALGLAALLRRWRAAVALAILLPLVGLTVNLAAASERGQHHVPDALAAMADPLPPGSLVVAGSDLTAGAFLYARLVEGRPLDQVLPGLLSSEWYLASLPADRAEAARAGGLAAVLQQARAAGTGVYLDHVPPGVPGFFVPEGLLYRYLAPGEPIPDRVEASRRSLEILDSHPRRGDYRLSADQPFWTRHLLQTWAWAYRTAAEGLQAADPAAAAEARRKAEEMVP